MMKMRVKLQVVENKRRDDIQLLKEPTQLTKLAVILNYESGQYCTMLEGLSVGTIQMSKNSTLSFSKLQCKLVGCALYYWDCIE